MANEMIQLAGGDRVPKACVDALVEYENIWPGATFHNARAAIAREVLKAVGFDFEAYEKGES